MRSNTRVQGGTARPGRAVHDRTVRVRVKAWVDWPDSAEVGPGRAALLRAIKRHGSINVAARTVGIAYRTAWNWIQAMNAVADCPLVTARPGGTTGGGAALTPAGDAVVTALDGLHDRVANLSAAATVEFTTLLARIAGSGVKHRAAPPRRTRRRTSRK